MSSSNEEYKLTVTTGGVTINLGDSSVSTDTISTSGAVTIGGTLGVTGVTTLSNDLSVTGTTSVTGQFDCDNIRIDGSTISSILTNSDIILAPDGTGITRASTLAIGISSTSFDFEVEGSNGSRFVNDDDVVKICDANAIDVEGGVTIDGSLDVDNIKVNGNSIISTDGNGNIDLTPNGAGEVNISKVDIDSGAIDGTTIGATTPADITSTSVTVDNININGNSIISTDTDGDIDLTPNGAGEVNISKVDIDSGAIDNTIIGGSTEAAVSGTNILASAQLGYSSGGTVTQATDINTTVTLNAVSGTITCVSNTFSQDTVEAFTVTNSYVAASDVIILSQQSGHSNLFLTVTAVTDGAFNVSILNPHTGAETATVVLNFAIIKTATS